MIDPEDPFKRRQVSVLGRPMRYVDEGSGTPVVILSGNAAHSYQWRNIVRFLANEHRCIVPDLPGLGHSQIDLGDPGAGLTLDEHSTYLAAFLEIVDPLSRTYIVGHELGAALGAEWARHHDSSVAGFIAVEGVVGPIDTRRWDKTTAALFFRLRSDEGIGECLGQNAIIEEWLPTNTERPLTIAEMKSYRRPYPSLKSRRGLLRLIQQFPERNDPGTWETGFEMASEWCQTSSTPKLRIHAEDGLTSPGPLEIDWKECHTEMIPGRHFILEDSPAAVAHGIMSWMSGVE